MIIFDSNIWIAYLNKSDSTHKQALKLFQETNTKDILITEYLLLEIATVLKQIQGYEFAQRFIQLIIDENIPFLESKKFYPQTLLLFQSLKESKLSFVDVSLLHLSKKYKIKTFDNDLGKRLTLSVNHTPSTELKKVLDESEKNRDDSKYWKSHSSVKSLTDSLKK